MIFAARTAVPQILAPIMQSGKQGSFTFVNTSVATSATCSGTVNSCTVTMTHAISVGDALVIGCGVANTSQNWITSISAGGTYIQPATQNVGSVTGSLLSGVTEGYVWPATAVASGGTITINMVNTTGTLGATCFVRDYSVSGGTPVLLAFNSFGSNSTTSTTFLGPPLSFRSKALVVASATPAASGNCTAVDGTWGNLQASPGGNEGTCSADQIGVTSVTAPTWTGITSPRWAGTILALGFVAPSSSYYQLTDGGSNTNGSAVTAAGLNAATYGQASPGSSASFSSRWAVTGSAITWATATAIPIIFSPKTYFATGMTYPNTATVGFSMPSNNTTSHMVFSFPGATNLGLITAGLVNTTTSACYLFGTSLPQNTPSSVLDYASIGGGSGNTNSHFVTMRILPNGTHITVGVELQTSGTGTLGNIATNTNYVGCLQSNSGGLDEVALYDTSLNLIGSFTSTTINSGNVPLTFTIGDVGSSNISGGYIVYWDKISLCYQVAATCALNVIQ